MKPRPEGRIANLGKSSPHDTVIGPSKFILYTLRIKVKSESPPPLQPPACITYYAKARPSLTKGNYNPRESFYH
jgi:hypothetical protein